LKSVEKKREGKVIHLECEWAARQITVDEILVGAGRAPNVDGLDLERVGVSYDERKGVRVDEYLRTDNPRIFAAGDVCSPFRFTHAADAMARIVIQNALFGGRKRASALNIPWCSYTDPEIAHVGAYEKELEKKGIPFQVFTIPMAEVDRAVADGETEGMVRVHVRKGSGRILGATIVASHAGEMIGEITTAMHAKMSLGGLSGVIHPYPTQAEGIRKAADAFNRTKLTTGVKRLLSAILKWQRGK